MKCNAFSARTLLVGWQEGYPVCKTRSSADADNALDANEAVPNKWRADGTHNTYQSY